MTRPLVTATTERLYDSLKRGATSEPADAATGWMALLLLASVGDQLDPVAEVVSDSDAGPGWSAVLDAARCPAWALPWLGQFVGVRVPQGSPEPVARTIVQDEAGFGRGTVAAIKAAAKPWLKPGFEPIVLERDESPYRITVGVHSSWLLGDVLGDIADDYATLADLQADVATLDALPFAAAGYTEAVLAAKPMALVMNVVIATTGVLLDLVPFGTLADLATAFSTLGDIAAYHPPGA